LAMMIFKKRRFRVVQLKLTLHGDSAKKGGIVNYELKKIRNHLLLKNNQ